MAWTHEKELEYLKKRQEDIDSNWNSYRETALEQSRWRFRSDAFQSQEWQDKERELCQKLEYEYHDLRGSISAAASYNRNKMRAVFVSRLSSMLDAGFGSEASREECCKDLLEKKETPFLLICSALNLNEARVSEIASEIGVDIKELPAKMKVTLGDEYRIRRRPWLEPDCASSEEQRRDKRNAADTPQSLVQKFDFYYSWLSKSWAAEAVLYDAGAAGDMGVFSRKTISPERFHGIVARQVCKAIKWRVLYEQFASFYEGAADRKFISHEVADELSRHRNLSFYLITELVTQSIRHEDNEAWRRTLKMKGVPEKIHLAPRLPEGETKDSGLEEGKCLIVAWTHKLPDTFAELEQLAGSGRQ